MSNAKTFAGVMHNTSQSERAKKAEALRQEKTLAALKTTETNFPGLGGSVCKTTPAWNNKFSDLASDWKQADDEKKDEEYRQEKRRQEQLNKQRVILPNFYNRRRFAEPGDEAQPEPSAEELQSSPKEDDEWTTVVRKTRKPKPEIDYSAEQESSEEQIEEDTVWNNEDDGQRWDKHGF
jgi:hypothetical protein